MPLARSVRPFVKHAEALLLTLHQHCRKEQGVLDPMMERLLARSCGDLLKAVCAFRALDEHESIA